MSKLLPALVLTLVACGHEPPPAQPPAIVNCPAPVHPAPKTTTFVAKGGLVRFVNRIELPNTTFTMRGNLEISIENEIVVVRDLDDPDRIEAFPRERLLYAGSVQYGD